MKAKLIVAAVFTVMLASCGVAVASSNELSPIETIELDSGSTRSMSIKRYCIDGTRVDILVRGLANDPAAMTQTENAAQCAGKKGQS